MPARSDPQSSSRPAATERDLRQEIHLAQLQSEKLTLELKVLRLRYASKTASDDHPTQTSAEEKSTSRKKRVIDWPHEFAPGNPSDYDKIELAEFVTGFLAMIKPYDNPKKSAMLEYLDLLMTKASSYCWPSVHAFHAHVAKQIELCRLEWTSFTDICDKAVTFFKHRPIYSLVNLEPISERFHPRLYATRPIPVHRQRVKQKKFVDNGIIMVLVPLTSQIWNLLMRITNAAFVQKSTQCCIAPIGKILYRLQILLDYRMITSCTRFPLQF